MAAIPGQTRARRAHLAVEKHDKAGRRYIGQNEALIGSGLYSSHEAERELQKAADESEEPVVDLVVEPYGPREVQAMDGNPRRGESEHTQWGGFQGADWLPESPLLRNRESRREQAPIGGAESG